jgi:NADH-quinone oxidoreductase subunit J
MEGADSGVARQSHGVSNIQGTLVARSFSSAVSSSSAVSMLETIAFYVLAALILGFGAMVITARNPVHSVVFLVLNFLTVAMVYIVLGAEFLAVIQVLVYAGAVMVLFLFIIMLLDLRTEAIPRINWPALAGGIALALVLLIEILFVIGRFRSAREPFPPLATSTIDDVRNVGALLFSNYNLPFQIIGVLVLVATIGVVLLSKRESR